MRIRKTFLIGMLFSVSLIARQRSFRIFTIMLDPAGDARETGRIIDDTLERAITFEFTQALQEAIESYLPNSKIIITRKLGEVVRPLQNANFANQLPVDLYLNINCVKSENNKSILSLYQFSLGDTFVTHTHPVSMIPCNKAHQCNAQKTALYGKKIFSTLQEKDHARLFKTEGLFQIPFTPLAGIQAPALALEVNVTSKNNWKHFIEPVALSIALALES